MQIAMERHGWRCRKRPRAACVAGNDDGRGAKLFSTRRTASSAGVPRRQKRCSFGEATGLSSWRSIWAGPFRTATWSWSALDAMWRAIVPTITRTYVFGEPTPRPARNLGTWSGRRAAGGLRRRAALGAPCEAVGRCGARHPSRAAGPSGLDTRCRDFPHRTGHGIGLRRA